MGNACCTKDTMESDYNYNYLHMEPGQLQKAWNMRQVALLIKVQARFRGIITRNRLR